MTELPFRSAAELAAAIRAGEISSTELLNCYLDRIERLSPRLGAVVTLDADGARREAAAAGRRLAQGAAVGPLHGLPVGIQIVGPYLHDRTVIAFARLLAGLHGGFTPPPACTAPAA